MPVLVLLMAHCGNAGNTTQKKSDNTEAEVGPVGKLYLNTTMWSGSLSITWIWLGANGDIVVDPKHGADPIDLAAEAADNKANTGTYKVVGKDLVITWKNGKSGKWPFEKDKGDYSYINGGVTTRQPVMPANYKLEGKYSAGAITANLSASSTIVFSKDGKFTEGRLGGVSTTEAGATSTDNRSGTYNVTGNTLKLNYNGGKKEVAVIAVMMIGARKWLIINSSSYPQQN